MEQTENKQWKPCSKGFALAHPSESRFRYRYLSDVDWIPWLEVKFYSDIADTEFQFETTADGHGYLCFVPAGTESVEIRLTSEDGEETSTPTLTLNGRKGRIVFVEAEQ
jgi:hypothetical protein